MFHEFSHADDYFNGTFAYNYTKYGYNYALYASEVKAYSLSSEYYYSIGDKFQGRADWMSMIGYKSLILDETIVLPILNTHIKYPISIFKF